MPARAAVRAGRLYLGGGGPGGVLDEVGVLDAVGRMGTPGVLEAAGRTGSGCSWVGMAGPVVAVGRMRKATVVCCPAFTVTLSSVKPSAGCHARTRYFPAGIPSMVNAPEAEVCAK